MFCRQCGSKVLMKDTQGGESYGTGEKVFRCVECSWTGVESACLKEVLETSKIDSKDILYNGIKYEDYEAVITLTDANGKEKIEFTTWRADIITGMMELGIILPSFRPGDTFTVVAKPNKLMMSTALFKVNQG